MELVRGWVAQYKPCRDFSGAAGRRSQVPHGLRQGDPGGAEAEDPRGHENREDTFSRVKSALKNQSYRSEFFWCEVPFLGGGFTMGS